MAGSDSSKDTQEEKPRLNQTDLPSCLNLILPRKEQWPNIFEGSANNSMYCMKDKGTEELRNYVCFSEGTQQILSNFSSAQIYSSIQFLKEEQELRLESYKCWPNIFEGSANNSMYCMKDKGTEELRA